MLKTNFCSSPWYHLRIRHDGSYDMCRWGENTTLSQYNIATHSFEDFVNSSEMKRFRMDLLNGNSPSKCISCYHSEKSGQLPGRIKQLLKSGIRQSEFDETFLSSPHKSWFEQAWKNNGNISPRSVDLQIDLSNVCNNACIMCSPRSSTRLGYDFEKLHNISPTLFEKPAKKIYNNWAADKKVLNQFIDEINKHGNELKYIHFLGGETLYVEEFYTICEALIASGHSKNIVVGTTTNGTIFSDRLTSIISSFKECHLGISIETVNNLNDYIRYGSKIDKVLNNIEKFLSLRNDYGPLHLELRTTFSALSIYHADSLLDFMFRNNISSESCHVMHWPAMQIVELLPENIKENIQKRILNVLKHYEVDTQLPEIDANPRVRGHENQQTHRIGNELLKLLKMPEPIDVENRRTQLVQYLKAFEQIRHNCILDYLPEYEEFLRSYNY